MQTKVLEVTNLTKKYAAHTAVDHISFSISDNQVLGFLGPNGAGKSTTMNMLTGCLSATEGSVKISGIDAFAEPRKAKAMIGYLPETPPLYPDFTPFEYLSFVAEVKGVKKSDIVAEVADVMEKTHITHMKDRLIKNLSKGYKQRVGIAQAIIGNPRIIILDEPTVGLDPKQISEIRDLISNLGKEHIVLFSSHILSEVSAICDNVIIISGGKMLVHCPIDKLTENKESLEEVFLELTENAAEETADEE